MNRVLEKTNQNKKEEQSLSKFNCYGKVPYVYLLPNL